MSGMCRGALSESQKRRTTQRRRKSRHVNAWDCGSKVLAFLSFPTSSLFFVPLSNSSCSFFNCSTEKRQGHPSSSHANLARTTVVAATRPEAAFLLRRTTRHILDKK